MKTDGLWKMLAAAFIVALFYLGGALYELAGGESLTSTAYGEGALIGPALTVDAEDVLITSSADGQKLHLWTFGQRTLNELRMPRFQRTITPYDK